MENKKTARDKLIWKQSVTVSILLVVFVILLPVAFFCVAKWFVTASSLPVGIMNFVQSVIARGYLGLLAITVVIVIVTKLIRANASFKQKIAKTVIIGLCVIIAFFLVRPLILDIPYLKHPKTIYLDCLEFEIERGTMDTTSDHYYLHGVDTTGEEHSFKISEKQLKDGRKLYSKNKYQLFAEISYLPHTSALISLKFVKELDVSASELYSPSSELPEN